MPRASGKRRTSGRKLNLLPSKPQESRYVPQLFSRLLDVFIQCCLSVSILLANSRFHDGAPSPGPKTPTKRSPTHRSVAVTDSDRTHPESQAATQALQPYYGPDLDTPIKHLAEGGPLPLPHIIVTHPLTKSPAELDKIPSITEVADWAG